MSDDVETVPLVPSNNASRLTIVASGVTQIRELPLVGSVTIGRSRSADVTVDDASLSREHGRLELTGGGVQFVDLGSSNGSWVAGARAQSGVALTVGDGEILELGEVIFIVHRPQFSRQPDSDEASKGSAMEQVRFAAERAAKHRLNVLVLGETGVGKGVLARSIHEASPRADGPFVVIDCAVLAPNVVESELFGHERGAFTGATSAKPGLLEAADGGTAFLDEIGELDPSIQAKLLRAIEERKVRRVGSTHDQEVDVRFIAATNRELDAEAKAGRFRTDLLYRLNTVTLRIPPLRARPEEILPLARKLLVETAAPDDPPALTAAATRWLLGQTWPGNVRELRNAVERAFANATGPAIDVDGLAPAGFAAAPEASVAVAQPSDSRVVPPDSSEADERARIIAALDACAGNQTKAAEQLGISRRTLVHRLDIYGLPRPRKKRG